MWVRFECRGVVSGYADAPASTGLVSARSHGRGKCAESAEGVLEYVLPGPACREVQRPSSGGAGVPARDGEQPSSERLGVPLSVKLS